MTVRKHKDGRRFYDQVVVETTTPPAQTGATGKPLGVQNAVGVDTLSIGDLLPEVKKNVSKVVDAEGKPLVPIVAMGGFSTGTYFRAY